jgi:hypothetical protein
MDFHASKHGNSGWLSERRPRTLDALEMKVRAVKTRRGAAVLEAGSRRDRFAFESARDDLARILAQLTQSIDRFEVMVRDQRQLSASGEEIVTTARRALEDLERLLRVAELDPDADERQPAGGRAQD